MIIFLWTNANEIFLTIFSDGNQKVINPFNNFSGVCCWYFFWGGDFFFKLNNLEKIGLFKNSLLQYCLFCFKKCMRISHRTCSVVHYINHICLIDSKYLFLKGLRAHIYNTLIKYSWAVAVLFNKYFIFNTWCPLTLLLMLN